MRPSSGARRCSKSEFMLRWVSLDITAVCALLQPSALNDLGSQALDVVQHRPSIGDRQERREEESAQVAALNAALASAAFPPADLSALEGRFRGMAGQQRALIYQSALRLRLAGHGRGMPVFTSLRPDFIPGVGGEYRICSVTQAAGDDQRALTEAIKRTGHTVEFTAHMVDGLSGLETYLSDKIMAYAQMVESV